MRLALLLFAICILFHKSDAQSKKEQIALLNMQIDSLNSFIYKSNEELKKLENQINQQANDYEDNINHLKLQIDSLKKINKNIKSGYDSVFHILETYQIVESNIKSHDYSVAYGDSDELCYGLFKKLYDTSLYYVEIEVKKTIDSTDLGKLIMQGIKLKTNGYVSERVLIDILKPKDIFELEGLEYIDIFDELNNLAAFGVLDHIEWVSMEGERFIAVYKISKPENNTFLYFTTHIKDTESRHDIDCIHFYNEELDWKLLKHMKYDYNYTTATAHYELFDENTLSFITSDNKTVILLTNDKKIKILYKSPISFYCEFTIIPKETNGLPLLIASFYRADHEYIKSNLLYFNGDEYVISKDNKISKKYLLETNSKYYYVPPASGTGTGVCFVALKVSNNIITAKETCGGHDLNGHLSASRVLFQVSYQENYYYEVDKYCTNSSFPCSFFQFQENKLYLLNSDLNVVNEWFCTEGNTETPSRTKETCDCIFLPID